MSPKTKSYSSWRNERLADPERAARYLSAAYKDSTEAFVHALKNVIQAHQVSAIAKKVGVSRENLYRTENPTITTLRPLLHALGVDIPEFVAVGTSTPSPPSAPVPLRPKTLYRRRRGTRGAPESQLDLNFDSPVTTAYNVTAATPTLSVSPLSSTSEITPKRQPIQTESSGGYIDPNMFVTPAFIIAALHPMNEVQGTNG